MTDENENEPVEEVRTMATVHDVAAYVLGKFPRMTTMKLQKLCYYSQAWHLTWTGSPLFQEEIQAWAKGPVVYDLYLQHRGKYWVDAETIIDGDSAQLSAGEKSTIDSVLEAYWPLSAAQLSAITHEEAPWKVARLGLADGVGSNRVIDHDSMRNYYASLSHAQGAVSSAEDVQFPAWIQG